MAHLNLNGKEISTMNSKPLLADNNHTNFDEADVMNGYVDYENNLHLNRNTGINIKFQNIIYRVRRHIPWDRSTTTILNGVNGEFRAGELTAIMGPSGAGKSTLLDILTGYIKKLASGTITVNGHNQCKNLKIAYIIQDCQLQLHITVWEAMFFAINLKVGAQLQCDEKKERIKEILQVIGLYEQQHTKTGKLSGGQRKLLAIALELVDDPQIMVFDEPTSGLDSSTSVLVVSLLKQLAEEGRTIICSIHQPSVRLYNLFDHLYAIADGQCIYSGATEMLIPFLSELDLVCPKTYDPFDYLLEISTNEYGAHNQRLVAKIQNGSNESYRKKMKKVLPATNYISHNQKTTNGITLPMACETDFHRQSNGTYATSFWRQWYLLTMRMIRCFSRDRSLGVTRLTVHFFVALVVGGIYVNIGDDAGQTLINYRFIFAMLMFFMHTSFCAMTILFPIEMPIVAREHFNRWYSAKAYYFALTFTDFPVQFACVLIYVVITYLMTGQPLESFRFIYVLTMATLLALVSQTIGMVVGAAFGVKLAVIIGPFLQAPPLIFSGFFVHLTDASPNLHWLFYSSYLRYALEGSIDSIFSYNRPKLQCNEMYCHYQIPAKFIKEVDMHRNDFYSAFIILVGILVCFRVIAFVVVAWRLKRK